MSQMTDAAAGWVLQVHGGRLNGARQPLVPGTAVTIGHGFDNQLVLRGRGTHGLAFTLELLDTGGRIKLNSGELTLLGCVIPAGGSALLPPYVPLQVGEFAIAVGEAGSARWAEFSALATTAVQPDPDQQPPEAPQPGMPVEGVQRWLATETHALGRQVAQGRRPLWLMAAAAALLAVVAVPLGLRTLEDLTHSPAKLQQELALAGMAGLTVREDPATGALIVSGRVGNDAAVERVRALADAGYGPVTLELTTSAQTALALNSLLEAEGIDAEARADRQGIAVHTEYLPRDRLAAIQARISADLPDAGPIRFLRDQDRGPRDLQYFFASERFGLATLVDGEPGHIVTADGQYWFAGALLPTGHRLLDVRDGAIRFERNGLTETLRVAAPRPPQEEPEPDTSTTTTATFITAKAGKADPAT